VRLQNQRDRFLQAFARLLDVETQDVATQDIASLLGWAIAPGNSRTQPTIQPSSSAKIAVYVVVMGGSLGRDARAGTRAAVQRRSLI